MTDAERLPWDEQLALDDVSYRGQLAYLLERSPFYHEKLAGFDPYGLAEISELPLTEKGELRATVTAENPFGAHLCASPDEIVRIYSTSGTTGTPSYIPLTAGDLENWVAGGARSYGASGVSAGQRIVSTYNAGPFVAGAALAAFDRIGLCHIPVGTGNTERLLKAVELLRPEAVVLTPSYAAYLVEAAAERDLDLSESSVERVLVAGEPGEARAGLGREGHRGDGDRRHWPVALGRVRGAERDAPRRARLRAR
jgi:phenylacetate-CoA ligase